MILYMINGSNNNCVKTQCFVFLVMRTVFYPQNFSRVFFKMKGIPYLGDTIMHGVTVNQNVSISSTY